MSAPESGFRSRFSVERMLRIHDRLRDGAAVNCTRLAAEIEVSRKTIQRDIDHMRDRLGLPIEYDRAAHSYAYTRPVESFPTVQMSEGDAVALFVAERALEPLRGTPLFDRLQATFDKLTANLRGTIDVTAEDHLAVSFRHFGEGRTNAAAFDILQRARDRRLEVVFDYHKPGEDRTEQRRVRPYHLTHRENLWYLVAFDCERNAIRTFALPRMSAVVLTRQTFALPTDFDPDAFFASTLGIVEGKGDYDIRIRFSSTVAHRIEERDWHESQQLRPLADGAIELRLRLSSLGEIARWVLGWGDQAEVLSPPELREQLRITTAAMASRYETG